MNKSVLALVGLWILFAMSVFGFLYVYGKAFYETGYNRGWCAGHGGTYISSNVCNVGGRVVQIERED